MKNLKYLLVVLIICAACNEKKTESEKPEILLLATGDQSSGSTYFTKDESGNPVLCWTGRSVGDSTSRLEFAFYDRAGKRFNRKGTVSPSAGAVNSSESTNKIAFKSDGTMVAVFGRAFKNEKNPFAGAIYYASSNDNGKSWSKEAFLHRSDTSHAYGRGFFDLARLENGELAAVWLDGRFGKSIKGLALFFAKTGKGEGFGADSCLYKGTCECCRTGLITGPTGDIYIAFRDILQPVDLNATEVRDVGYLVSSNEGATFSPLMLVSSDGWKINGCPHSGPSLSMGQNGLSAVWFTGGDSRGIYYARNSGGNSDFRPRILLSKTGRHPQLLTLPNGKQAVVCEEGEEEEMSMNHGMEGAPEKNHAALSETHAKIVLRILNDGRVEKEIPVTDGKYLDHNAVITTTPDGLLMAWTREENGIRSIYYTLYKI